MTEAGGDRQRITEIKHFQHARSGLNKYQASNISVMARDNLEIEARGIAATGDKRCKC